MTHPPQAFADPSARRTVSATRIVSLALVAAFLLLLACSVCSAAAWVSIRVLGGSVGSASDVLRQSGEVLGRGGAAVQDGPGGATGAEVAGGDTTRSGGTLHLPGGDPATLDPALVGDVTSAEYIYEIFSGLVTLSPELEVVPDLATSWQISEDGTVYTFELRPDAVFHDGSPVDAGAIAYAIERACDPATGSPVAETYLGDIVGCVDKLNGRATAVTGVRVPADDRLTLTIDAPKSYFLAKLTYPASFALDRGQVETDSEWYRRPNGTGPFRLAEYTPEERILLTRNEAYYGAAAQLDAVEFDLRPVDPLTRYENGELDAAPVGSVDIDRVDDPLNPLSDEVVTGPGDLDVNYVGFNVELAPFDDVHVRRAFNLALDKRRLTEVVLSGAVKPIDTILPPGMPGFDPQLVPYPFDPDRARVELAASRYGSAESVPPVTLDVPGEGGAPVAEAVADYISETLGVAVTVEQTPWNTYQTELDERSYDMFMLGWSADYPDPQDFLDVLFHSRSPMNHSGYANDDVDALLEEARLEANEDKRLGLYNDAERLVLADAPWLPVYTGVSAWLVAPYVHDFALPAIVRPRLAAVRIDPP